MDAPGLSVTETRPVVLGNKRVVSLFGYGMRVLCTEKLPFWPTEETGLVECSVELLVHGNDEATWLSREHKLSRETVGRPRVWSSDMTYIVWSGFAGFAIKTLDHPVRAWLKSGLDLGHMSLAFANYPMGLLLLRSSQMSLHAGAVFYENAARLIIGKKGDGKSTTVATWLNSGARFLSDDHSAIYGMSQDLPYTTVSLPWVRLWPEGIQRLGYDYSKFPRAYPETEKRIVWFSSDWKLAPTSKIPIGSIFVLSPTSDMVGPHPNCRSVSTNEAANILFAHVYSGMALSNDEKSEAMNLSLKLASKVPVCIVEYNKSTHPPSLVVSALQTAATNSS